MPPLMSDEEFMARAPARAPNTRVMTDEEFAAASQNAPTVPAAPQPDPWSPAAIAQRQMALERQAHETAERRGFQGVREVAADAVRIGGPMVGVTLGAPGGIPGMAVGGAVAGAASERLAGLIEGAPEPTPREKLAAVASGAIAGAAGGAAQKAVNVFLSAFMPKATTRLSFDMQTRAKDLDRAYRAANPGVGTGSKGFASPEAKDLWSRSQVVDQLEQAIVRSRGNPDRLREQFARLAAQNRLMRRLTPEQRALVDDVSEQGTLAGMLRSLGELRNLLDQGIGAGAVRMVAGPFGVGAAGRAVDRAATQRLADAALQGVAGVAPSVPAAPPAGIAALGAGAVRPLADLQAQALANILGAPRQ
jgi:hypothetical protein